uniref:Uncharacterized protein n=1 Tax=Anguilla anguilla TaxID=7936 RepID=A0A0E9VYC2_ANGAN
MKFYNQNITDQKNKSKYIRVSQRGYSPFETEHNLIQEDKDHII